MKDYNKFFQCGSLMDHTDNHNSFLPSGKGGELSESDKRETKSYKSDKEIRLLRTKESVINTIKAVNISAVNF